MGKPLMIQLADDKKIEDLKRRLNAKTKVQVLRSALELLEQELSRIEKSMRWKKAAKLVSDSSREVLADFSHFSLLKRP